MKPSVGRIVHYQAYGSAGGKYPSVCRAAVITEVHDDTTVSLAVLNPTGAFFDQECRLDGTDKRGGTFHWPERVD